MATHLAPLCKLPFDSVDEHALNQSGAPLRLLCVSHYFESHRGGIEIVAGRLARSLIETGVAVTWVASDASSPSPDVPCLSLSSSNLIERRSGLPFPLHGPMSLARLVAAVRTSDAVLVHDGMYPICIAAIVAARLCGRPVLLVQHIGRVPGSSVVLTALFSIADRFLTRPMLRLASQVVFISATSARHFSDVSTRRDPILIFNGVDTKIFRPSGSEHERELERKQNGWPNERPVILFVGRFLEKKGLLRLREMSEMRPDYHWAYAGWGPCDPDSWTLPNVTVHRGLSGADLARLYRGADVFALPSKSEGFPLVVQEALACGLRPVCCEDAANADPAAVSQITSISNDGSEADVVARYLAAIDALATTSDTLSERASRAGFAERQYAWSSTTERYCAVLRSLMPGSKCFDPKKGSNLTHARSVPRYLVVGAACALLANGILIGFDQFGIPYVVSSVAAFAITLVLAYALHTRWTFGAERSVGGLMGYGAAMALNLPISIALLFLFISVLGLEMAVAAPLATVFQTGINYLVAALLIRPSARP